jgi:[NiFe] hydrogenase diaphorase moiety large subunit
MTECSLCLEKIEKSDTKHIAEILELINLKGVAVNLSLKLEPSRIDELKTIAQEFNCDQGRLLDVIWKAQEKNGFISREETLVLAESLNCTSTHIDEVLSFYHFFRQKNSGKFQIYLDTSIISLHAGMNEIIKEFETQLGIKLDEVTPDGMFGIFPTSCIGMSDQSPAALINMIPFPALTVEKVKKIISGLKKGESVVELSKQLGGVENKAYLEDLFLLKKDLNSSTMMQFPGLKKALTLKHTEIIEEIKKSGLRGRGGAGFPTGKKWEFCRSYNAPTRYVVCNADEGEPGTFKDRLLLTNYIPLLLEGMSIAALAIDAKEAFIYLRAEYKYLLNIINDQISQFSAQNKSLDLKFRVQLGAGAYVCGEESALLESLEGKRGEPRLRPPFPVECGYKNAPTVVNNVETYILAARIMSDGAEAFAKLGTEQSKGVRLLSVSGDIQNPGIYEIPWGTTVREVLTKVGAKNPSWIQVGGPSGECISMEQADRKIAFEDLPTGGSFMVFSDKRDHFEIMKNFMDFFVFESCGNCAPCRAGTVVLRDLLVKFQTGHARLQDVDKIKSWSNLITKTSRCGLGATASNPMTSAHKAFPTLFSSSVKKGANELIYDFDEKTETQLYTEAATSVNSLN